VTIRTPPIIGSGIMRKKVPSLVKTPNIIIKIAPIWNTLRLAAWVEKSQSCPEMKTVLIRE